MAGRKGVRRSRQIEDDDLLNGWREIAAYLQCSEKSGHRWERDDDLPIIRPGHSRKGPVFASKRSLKAWLRGGIASAVLSDTRLIVFDRKARVLWAHDFVLPLHSYTKEELDWRLRFIDLHGDGDVGVLMVADFLSPTMPDQVLYFSSEGEIEWTLEPKPQLRKQNGAEFEDAWVIKHLIVVPRAMGHAVYLAMANAAGWAGCILSIDAAGSGAVWFANAGYVESLCSVVTQDDWLIVACGENNDFDCAFVALLGIDDPPSTSISGKRSVYRYANAPTEVPRKYILFPKTELIAARNKPYGHAQRIRQYPDRIIVEVETGGDGGCILYHFTEYLEPIFAFPSGSHEFFHRKLEATGEIQHQWLQCPELKRPLALQTWTRISDWREEKIPWRDNPWNDDSAN